MDLQRRRLLLTAALFTCFIATANADITDRSRNQFREFFSTAEQFWKPIWLNESAEENCIAEFDAYFSDAKDHPGVRQHAQNLLDCTLSLLSEFSMANMAATAILLALLPVGLVSLGPTMAELAFLSTRRPILAALLGFGALSPNPSQEFEFESIVDANKELSGISGRLYHAKGAWRMPVIILLTILEYAIAIGATFNAFFQVWRLTYRAVSLAPIAVYLHGIPEEATLFGWVFLSVPLQIVGFMSFFFYYKRSPQYSQRRNGFIRLFTNELTVAAVGPALPLAKRTDLNSRVAKNAFGAASRLLASLHVIVGTVLLGSTMYVLLGDGLGMIYTFVAAAVATKLVVVFELQGLGYAVRRAEEREGGDLSAESVIHVPRHGEMEKANQARSPFLAETAYNRD